MMSELGKRIKEIFIFYFFLPNLVSSDALPEGHMLQMGANLHSLVCKGLMLMHCYSKISLKFTKDKGKKGQIFLPKLNKIIIKRKQSA